MGYASETSKGVDKTGKTAVLFQGVTMNFREVFAKSDAVRNTVKNLQDIWGRKGVCELDLVKICTNPNYPPEEKTRYEQPTIFAVSLASFEELKRTCEPDILIGHSFGEYAALCQAGVFTPENGYLITNRRGILTSQANMELPGLMAAVSGQLDIPNIKSICDKYEVDIGNKNSPEQLVISGEEQAVRRVCQELENMDLRVVRLDTGCYFHSRYLQNIKPQFRRFLETIDFKPPKIPVIMNATAQPEKDPKKIKDYLANQLTDPVNFPEIVNTMHKMGVQKTHEIGARNILTSFMRIILRRP